MMMDVLAEYLSTKQDILVLAAFVEAFLIFAFVICSFVVADTANSGFNVVLTSFLNIGFLAGSYYVVRKSKAPIAFGFLIGSGSMMAMLNFMTAVHWGQLSMCERVSPSVSQYSCENTVAYGAVCFFAVALFVLQTAFTALVVLWKDDLVPDLAEATHNTDAFYRPDHSNHQEAIPVGSFYTPVKDTYP